MRVRVCVAMLLASAMAGEPARALVGFADGQSELSHRARESERHEHGRDLLTFLGDQFKERNSECAATLRAFADQIVCGATGINPEDWRRYGIGGGPNSELRRACNALTGLFGGHCRVD